MKEITQFRLATTQDAANIIGLISLHGGGNVRPINEQEIAKLLDSGCKFWLGSDTDGNNLGLIGSQPATRDNFQIAEIRSVTVHPDARGNGAVGKMLGHVSEQHPPETVFFGVTLNQSVGMQRGFQRYGYTELSQTPFSELIAGHLKDTQRDLTDRIVWVKDPR